MTKQNPFFKMVKGDTAFIYKDKSEDNTVYGVKITDKKFLKDYICEENPFGLVYLGCVLDENDVATDRTVIVSLENCAGTLAKPEGTLGILFQGDERILTFTPDGESEPSWYLDPKRSEIFISALECQLGTTFEIENN